MGLSNEPNITQVDPTNPALKPLQNDISGFLGNLFNNPSQSPFSSLVSPLQQLSTGGIQQFLSQPSPEQQTLQQVQPALQGILDGQANGQLGFDPNAGFQAGQRTIAAAQPIFAQNLNTAIAGAANRAPSVQNSAFGRDVGNISTRALQDFNLFQQQALQQGLGQDIQARGQGLNFLLGQQQNQLGAGGLLGQLAGQAGNNPFNRLVGAGQLGNQFSQSAINPTLQLLLGGLGFAQPQGLDTIVGNNGLGSSLGGAASGALTGAAIGSTVPGLGTLLGAGIGGLGGFLGG